jgi:lysophospholipase L1-like esterase
MLFCMLASTVLMASAGAATPDQAAIAARSLVSLEDTARLQHVIARARRGEPITVGVIGGSITAGAAASTEENRYGNRIAKWWREAFPQAKIDFVNAGIGATGTPIACHRAQEHLLSHHPDFVVAEFAVNDGAGLPFVETLEGLLRQILKQPQQPAVMLMFTMNNAGGNSQDGQILVGQHYGLPMLSFRDALWPEIQAGRMKWEDVEGDEVHPNDRGHQYMADFVTAVIDRVRRQTPPDDQLPELAPTPRPMYSDIYEFARFRNADTATPLANQGWTRGNAWPFGACWQASKVGSRLEFEVEGTSVSVAFKRFCGPMAIAKAWVDDRPAANLDAWFSATWGSYSAWEMVARDLPPGKHRLAIEISPDKAEGSTGHEFELQCIFEAGLK